MYFRYLKTLKVDHFHFETFRMSAAPAGENVTQVSSMPIPPMHYVKLYTDEAVKRGTVPK